MQKGFRPDPPESAPLVFSEPENAVDRDQHGRDWRAKPLAESPTDFEAWKARIGDYVKFVDEQAVIEAFNAGTEYPLLYHGKLDDVLTIKIYQDEVLYARIKPMWSDDMQYIPICNVRLVD